MVFLLVLAGLILFVLAGLNVYGPRFHPEWFGLACLAAAAFWAVLRTGIPH